MIFIMVHNGSTSRYVLVPELSLDLVLEDGGQEINCKIGTLQQLLKEHQHELLFFKFIPSILTSGMT
jgi:hypothetical protein